MSGYLDRRTFLAGTAALALLARTRGLPVPTSGTAIGAGLEGEGDDERNVLCLLDLDDVDGRPRRIPLDFYGHGIAVDPTAVRVIQPTVGGGFGGKSMDDNNAVIAALLARATRRPVKLVNTREEDFLGGRPRLVDVEPDVLDDAATPGVVQPRDRVVRRRYAGLRTTHTNSLLSSSNGRRSNQP